MKKNISKKIKIGFRLNVIAVMTSALLVVSCGAQLGGYSETDGVYYDPNKDTLPEGTLMGNNGNSVGEYYQYDSNDDLQTYNNEYLEEVRSRDWIDNSKYWSGDSSDWGNYTGNNIYVNNYYGSYYPYYSYGFGYHPYGYYGSYMSFSWGWSNSWGWYSPYWLPNYYAPYWGGYYSYWGWNHPYYYGNNWRRMYPYQRSGANGGFNSQRNVLSNKANGSGVPNRSIMQRSNSIRNVQNPSYNGMRNQPMRNTNSVPNSSMRTPQNQVPRNNQPQMRTNSNENTRSGGSMMRGGSSVGGGSVRSGSTSTRSGGFR